ncbi:MAG: 50S ribosomal protein L5 [Caldisericales bacterium]|nr:50S ribosomal protein L5 [Caldisericales bacterium]
MAEKKPQAQPKKGDSKGAPSLIGKGGVSDKVKTKDLKVQPYQAKYKGEIISQLMKQFKYENVMQVPGIVKISINRGVGEATANPKALDSTVEEIFLISQQRPTIKKAKKSIANFKLRAGVPVGCMVTLRGNRMWAFVGKLIDQALPRIRDFKGLSPHSFDGRGNYTFGIKEQLIFPEIDYDKVDKTRGFNVSIVTSARTDEEARALLKAIGFPFREN